MLKTFESNDITLLKLRTKIKNKWLKKTVLRKLMLKTIFAKCCCFCIPSRYENAIDFLMFSDGINMQH